MNKMADVVKCFNTFNLFPTFKKKDWRGREMKMDRSKGFGGSKLTENGIESEDIEIFAKPSIDYAVQKGRTISYRPISGHNDGPFVWNLEPQGPDQYMQLNSVRLGGTCKIVNATGTDLTEEQSLKKVSIVNMFAASLFKSVEVEANSYLISALSQPMNHYQAYIQTLFSYNDQAAKTHLKTQLFDMDTVDHFDKSRVTDAGGTQGTDSNEGANRRAKLIAKSRKFDFYIPLASDFLQSDKLLYPSVKLRLKLTREKNSFSLLQFSKDTEYGIELNDLKLYVRYVTIHPDLVKSQSAQLIRNPLIYPIIRTQMKSYNLHEGQSMCVISNIFQEVHPKNIIVGMVSTEGFGGAGHRNPFFFHHYDIESMFIRVNGESIPTDPIRPDFKNNLFMREYMHLYRNSGCDSNSDFGNFITPKLYKGGCFFSAFDLSGHQCNMLHNHITKAGKIDLHIQFAEALTEEVTLIVYSSFDATVEIDSNIDAKVVVENPVQI